MLVQCYDMSRFVVMFADVLHLQEKDGSVINYAAVILHAEHITTPRVVVNINGGDFKNPCFPPQHIYNKQACWVQTHISGSILVFSFNSDLLASRK